MVRLSDYANAQVGSCSCEEVDEEPLDAADAPLPLSSPVGRSHLLDNEQELLQITGGHSCGVEGRHTHWAGDYQRRR